MKYYHASKHKYDFPSYENLIENRTNHANGNLGLWFSTKSDWIENFGKNVYEFEIDEKNINFMDFSECVKWHKKFKGETESNAVELECIYYQELRNELMKKHKVILFKETNGEIAMGIILDFTAIKDFKILEKIKITTKSVFLCLLCAYVVKKL